MNILGIETSCDESAVAIYNPRKGIISHKIHSQSELHAKYGGIMPEVASRDHIKKVIVLVKRMLLETGIAKNEISSIAYTAGPGLAGPLLIGATLARTVGYSLNIPTVGVNHLEGHILSVMLEDNPPKFPFVSLLISGGHTVLSHVRFFHRYEVLGETLDDAVGEAYDKTAKLLGLAYPGGPKLEALAVGGSSKSFDFPRPMKKSKSLNFSFSGLKTFVKNVILHTTPSMQNKKNIAYCFQEAVADTLVSKCKLALQRTSSSRLIVVGGVSSNSFIRSELKKLMLEQNGSVSFARKEFCTDNAAMIAYTGYLYIKKGINLDRNLSIKVKTRWSIADI